MSAIALLPKHLRPRREKVFGPARGIPLDRNAKARIKVYVQGYNARHRQPGGHAPRCSGHSAPSAPPAGKSRLYIGDTL